MKVKDVSKHRVWVHTPQTHLLGGSPLKPQKENFNQGRMMLIHGEENGKNQVLADR